MLIRVVRAIIHWCAAWFVFCPPRTRTPSTPVLRGPPDAECIVLFFHGNSGLASVPPWLVKAFGPRVAFYAPEYPGYGGGASAKASEAGVLAAADAAYEYACTLGFRPEQIYVWGLSLGGAAAAHLAATRPCAGIVMHAAFASVLTVVAPWVGRWARAYDVDMFTNVDRMRAVSCPVAFVHGTDDRLIRLNDHCTANFMAVPHRRKRVWRAAVGHSDVPDAFLLVNVAEWIRKKDNYS